MNSFYTYLWLRDDGRPYYAGKGRGKRAFINSGHSVHRPLESSRIIVQDFDSEEEAFTAEKFLIAYYGRIDLGTGCLRNLTDGGDGHSGYIPSLAQRAAATGPNSYCAKLTTRDLICVRAMASCGMSCDTLAAIFCVDRTSIHMHLRKLGFRFKKKISDEQRAKVSMSLRKRAHNA